MEAEVVRDSLLAVAGGSTALGGPDIDHAQGLTSSAAASTSPTTARARMPFLELFDAARRLRLLPAHRARSSRSRPSPWSTATRPRAISRLAVELWKQSDGRRRSRPAPSSRPAFEQVLSRSPSAGELAKRHEQFSTEPDRLLAAEPAAAPAAAPADKCPQVPASPDGSRGRARENLVHALFNHNDFVTIR